MPRRRLIVVIVIALLLGSLGRAVERGRAWHLSATASAADAVREEALQRAAVWREPTPGHLSHGDVHRLLTCDFVRAHLGGTTPKFDCQLENGDVVRVKYGGGPEIPSELASTRLVSALGFGADRVSLVERLRCRDCPPSPFWSSRLLAAVRLDHLFNRGDGSGYREYEGVAIERRFPGRDVNAAGYEGWAWSELDRIREDRGGAPRYQVDALRLLAVFLAHWDNKTSNQRLVCLSPDRDDGACANSFALIDDLGASFGPRKMTLANWRSTPIWEDRSTCVVGMRNLPYGGGTFNPPVRVSEAGRQFLGRRLAQLTDSEIAGLFRYARFDHYRRVRILRADSVQDWTAAFNDKVRQLLDGPACPA